MSAIGRSSLGKNSRISLKKHEQQDCFLRSVCAILIEKQYRRVRQGSRTGKVMDCGSQKVENDWAGGNGDVENSRFL